MAKKKKLTKPRSKAEKNQTKEIVDGKQKTRSQYARRQDAAKSNKRTVSASRFERMSWAQQKKSDIEGWDHPGGRAMQGLMGVRKQAQKRKRNQERAATLPRDSQGRFKRRG